MFARLRTRFRRLTERVLWIACCGACLVCLMCVFLSLYYLEDHHVRLACDGSSKDSMESHRPLLKSGKEGPWSIHDVVAENIELKRSVSRLSRFGSDSLAERPGKLLQERRTKYLQDLRAENIELKRTIKELRDLGSFKNLRAGFARSWQERSLKYITGDQAPRLELPDHYTSEISTGQGSFLRDNVLGCREISQIDIKEELGRGYTKLTQRGVYSGRQVAVKSVGLDSTDVHKCVQEKRARLTSDCLLFSRYKVMKELLLYQQLSHPNVVNLLGYCFQNDQDTSDIQSRGLTVVTELGTPLNLMTVLQMAWHQRFRIAVDLARLMKYFSVSPLGSLVIRDFQLIQFVIINGEVKLSDLDDVGNEEHSCGTSRDCVIGNQTYNITLPCVSGNLCLGYNEKWNLYNLQRFYLKMFLMPGAPDHVLGDLQRIEKQAALLEYNSGDLVRDLERVLGKLRNGQGLESEKYRPRYQYKAIARADFPGRHDYECDHSISLVNCQAMVFSQVEAMRVCDDDEECQAFVMSYDKTWIGYRWAYFKNNSTHMVFSAKNMVYVKVT